MTDPTVSREDLVEMIKDALAIYSNGVDDLWDQDVASNFVADALISSGVVGGQDWRPIETAHDDLTHADLWVIYHDGFVGSELHACRFADCYKDRGVWRDRGGNEISWGPSPTPDNEFDPSYREITHYMPLPAPPLPQPDGGGR